MNRFRARDRGSALLLVLFVCLACGALCLSLCALLSLAGEARISEAVGTDVRTRAEEGLAWARVECLRAWGPTEGQTGNVRTTVERLNPEEPLRMEACATVASGSDDVREHGGLEVRALVEAGYDGPPLPLAAVVATFCTASPGRTDPPVCLWLGADPTGSYPVPAYLCLPELSADLTCTEMRRMNVAWRLDEGTTEWLDTYPEGRSGAVTILRGSAGDRLRLPAAGSYEEPPSGLIMVLGGADLDLEGRGTMAAVVVVDGGSLYLEGTLLRGAAIVTDAIHLGESGAIAFDPTMLRWAGDQSLPRVRLVPGSRREEWLESGS